METPLHNIRCRSCHDSAKRPVMTRFDTPSEPPIYTVGCPNACGEPVRLEIDVPFQRFPAVFEICLEQPHTGKLAPDDPRNFFYVPQHAGDNE